MSDKTEFDTSKIKSKNKLILESIISILIIGYIMYFTNKNEWIRHSYVLMVPIFLIFDIVKYIKSKKKSLIITTQFLKLNHRQIIENWANINGISYKIKSVSSYVLVDLKDKNVFIKKQKWYTKIALHLNNLRFNTLFVINLEKIIIKLFNLLLRTII